VVDAFTSDPCQVLQCDPNDPNYVPMSYITRLIDIVKITHSSFGGAYKVGLHWVNMQDEFGT
jgi:hypothetical protein